jgi:uncharacterized protein (DUF305 family)
VPKTPLCRYAVLAACVSALITAGGGQLAAHQHQALAQTEHTMPAHRPSSSGAAEEAYRLAADRMHREMALELTGDPDLDFARGMIPHHQGAIEMARVVLEYGQDEELRKLAEAIVAAQEAEIAFLRVWLEKRGQKAG